MGSVFVTQPDRTVKGFLNKEYPVPFYLQFVAGYCVEVVHSEESLRYNGPESINSIIALPHYTDKVYKTRASAGEEYRYYPLLRTINDVPSKGDPVLLCTIGKIKYYLGPLNTNNNSPTWNDDPSFRRELVLTNQNIGQVSPRGIRGESPNFNKELSYSRLTKKRESGLDYGDAVNETTGDTIIEGRHGNSFRIGSRSNNPYVFISNKRFPDNNLESIGDGSLISITSNGSLRQHFKNLFDIDGNRIEFKLSSDTVENNTYPIGDIQSDLNNGADIQETIYGYGSNDTGEKNEQGETIFEGTDANQILFNSDRITLNSKLDDIFVSSIKDIHIGSGRHISISSNTSLNILSKNVNIGNSERTVMEPMVLGDALKVILEQICDLFAEIKVPTTFGPETPISPTTAAKANNVKNGIERILSIYHKIERN
tara:strand:- start:81 stop:1361 length:1281 start_codon:yes stop_codon:yes gene_type:complete